MYNFSIIKSLNPDLINISNNTIIKNINEYKLNKRLLSVNDFIKWYPNFNLEFYKNFSKDLYNFDNIFLISHFHNSGKYEDRIYSFENFFKYYKFNYLIFLKKYKIFLKIYNKVNNFYKDKRINNLKFYFLVNREINLEKCYYSKNDLKNFNYTIKYLSEKFIDYNYYRNKYSDLSTFTDGMLFNHWIKNGFYENRICSEKYLKLILFDYESYKLNNYDLKHLNSLNELYSHYLNNGINENRKLELYDYTNRTLVNKVITESINNDEKCIYILYTKYTYKEAKQFDKLLTENNISNKIMKYDLVNNSYKIPNNCNMNNLFILITPILLEKYPKNYIVFQMEQITGIFFTGEYIKKIKDAKYIFDYSRSNIKYFLENKLIDRNKLVYQQLEFEKKYYENKLIYDILFIGSTNERRQKIISNLRNVYKHLKFYIIDSKNPKFDDECDEIITKSKIVINLHFKQELPQLETPRILQLIHFNKLVISERCSMYDIEENYYSDLLIFVDIINKDLSNINILIDYIDYFSSDENYNNYIKILKNKKAILYKYINRINNNNNNLNKIIDSTKSSLSTDNLNPKIAVITINTNNYDNFNINKTENIDWFYFTDINFDELNKLNHNYILKEIKNLDFLDIEKEILDNYFLPKILKTVGIKSDFFKKYDFIIWCDASIKIKDGFEKNILNLVKMDYDIYLFKHYKYIDIYQEYKIACTLKKYNTSNLLQQIRDYNKNENTSGLYESGFIIYKNNDKIYNFVDEWFEHIKKYGNLCQLSLPIVLNKHFLNIYNLNEIHSICDIYNGNIWDNKYFTIDLNHNIRNIEEDLNKKINFIDKILWINLDRSKERRNYMENLLKNIKIPSQRISAIDGKIINKSSYKIKNIEKFYDRGELTNYEICCTLSHIKAINSLKNEEGDYFLILEDDISFKNIYMFKESLKNIILEAPKFEILILYKTVLKDIINKSNYVNFKDYNNQFGGTVSYIITKEAVKKFTLNNRIVNNTFICEYDNFSVADIYLYKNMNTCVYFYNYIDINVNFKSTIHNHLILQNKCKLINDLNMKYRYLQQ